MTGTRDIDASTATAAAAETIHPVLFAKLEFDGGDVLVHSELGDLAFGGDTYTGIGRLGSIGTAEEVSDLSRTPITLTLSGIPGDVVGIVFNEHYQGRRATIYLGYLDLTSRQLVADPTILYRGRMDVADLEEGKTFAVTIAVESRLAAWDKPLVRRYNDADQQARYPGDTGLRFVEQAADKPVVWGGPG